MEWKDQSPSAKAGTPPVSTEVVVERYEPPAVSWEEDFAPVADSICDVNPWDPSCQ